MNLNDTDSYFDPLLKYRKYLCSPFEDVKEQNDSSLNPPFLFVLSTKYENDNSAFGDESQRYAAIISVKSIENDLRFNKIESPELNDFLSSNPDLVSSFPFLLRVFSSFDVKDASIEYYKDIEEGWENLFIRIKTMLYDNTSIKSSFYFEQKIFEKSIFQLDDSLQEKITLVVS